MQPAVYAVFGLWFGHRSTLPQANHCIHRSRWRRYGLKMAKEFPEEVKLYDHFPKKGFVHIPGRCFPVIVQGDTLSRSLSKAMEILEKGTKYKDEDLYYPALDLAK